MSEVYSKATTITEWQCPECAGTWPLSYGPVYISAGASIQVDCPDPACPHKPILKAELRRLKRLHRMNRRAFNKKRKALS